VNPLLGITLKIFSTLVFITMSTQVKLVGGAYPLGEIVFCRAFFALIPLMIWLVAQGELINSVRHSNPHTHLRRCITGTLGMFCGFGALTLLPLPDATAIGYATPLITTALAALILKERVRAYRWSAVALGFCGMILILSPHLADARFQNDLPVGQTLGAILGIFGAVCSGFASIEVRKLAQKERTGTIVFYFSVVTSTAGFLTILFGWKMPDLRDMLLLIGSGIAGGVGQILLTSSFRYAHASVIAPFDYMSLLWALAIGFALFGDVPVPQVLLGAAIVILAGLFVIWRERQLGLSLRREREAGHHRPI
jgi:drug/metabolite transporter (DMT)-like permease